VAGFRLDWVSAQKLRLFSAFSLLLVASRLQAQDSRPAWIEQVRSAISEQHLTAALTIVDHRLTGQPADLEAHGWRGRLLAWTGRWPEAEAEYRLVLAHVPDDQEIAAGLADVLIWQQKYADALSVLDQARAAAPTSPEILIRRARVLFLLKRNSAARAQYKEALSWDPRNAQALTGLAALKQPARNELRISGEDDFFNYTANANTQSISLRTNWNRQWTTLFAINPYHLFGETAVKFVADLTRQFHGNNWVRVESGGANPQDVVPEREVLVEYGHGFRFSNPFVRGWETSYQQHALWYRSAQVLTVNSTQTLYLPKEWSWTLSALGSRTCFSAGACGWAPSGSAKVAFPLQRWLSGNLLFAVGAENFAQVDQIGRLSARTYGGGLRFRFAENEDINGFFARQNRQRGQTESSLGLGYGFRF
jgi:tetratricopeptide (TPR) repeat protein